MSRKQQRRIIYSNIEDGTYISKYNESDSDTDCNEKLSSVTYKKASKRYRKTTVMDLKSVTTVSTAGGVTPLLQSERNRSDAGNKIEIYFPQAFIFTRIHNINS